MIAFYTFYKTGLIKNNRQNVRKENDKMKTFQPMNCRHRKEQQIKNIAAFVKDLFITFNKRNCEDIGFTVCLRPFS